MLARSLLKLPMLTHLHFRQVAIAAFAIILPAGLLVYWSTPATAAAGINQIINFQGKVANNDGTNVADGAYDFVFKIYDGAGSSATTLFTENWTSSSLFSSTMSSAPSSGGESLTYSSNTNESTLVVGQILWNTTKKESVKITSVNTSTNVLGISPTRQAWSTSDTITNRIYVKNGLFTASINSLNHDLSGVNFNSDTIYFGINFNTDGEMKPRIQFTAVPYAFNATQVNGLSVTNNGGNVLNIGANKTLTVNNTITFGGTDATSFTLPSTSDTLVGLAANQALTNKTINGLTITSSTGTLSIANGKTLTASNTLTFTGTDGSSIAFGTGGTVCYVGSCGGITANSLDFSDFKDAMTLDASTDIALGSLTLSASGTGAVQFNNTGGLSSASDVTLAANKSIKLTGGTSFPGSPSEGQMFFRTDNKQLYIYENSKWQADRTTASETVAASNSQNKERADFVATGSSDESTINSAIAALPSSGGVVFLMAGTYSIGGPINVAKSNVTLMGEGKGTLIQRAWNDTTGPQNTGMITLGDGTNAYDGITVTNLQLDGVRTTYNNLYNNGILFKKKITNSRILNNSIINSYGEGIIVYGLGGEANSLNTIGGNEIKNNGGDTSHYGIHIYGPLTSPGYNTIQNNNVTAGGGVGIMIDNSNNNQIVGNAANSNGGSGIQVYQSSYNSVTGNGCSSNTSIGIIVNSTSTKNTVSGNTCNSNGGTGIQIGGDSNTITGNTVGSNGSNGIQISIASYNLVSGNNSRDNTNAGIYIDQGSNSNNIVGNNLYNNTGSGGTYSSIMVNGSFTSNNNSITDNVITDTAGTAYAIDISGSSANNTTLSGNTYSGTGATSVHDTGTNTLWLNQLVSSNLVFKPTGNIGLGTTSPTAQVHEKGNVATALSGTVGVTNGSPSVSTSANQTSVLNAGDVITFASQAGTVYTVSSLNSTTITLTANYTGTTNASTTAARDVTNLFQIDNGAGTTKLTFTKTGQLILGSAAANEQLDLDGRVYLADSSAPSTTTNRLYAVSGNLYWNGTQLGGATSSLRLDQITAANTTATIANGNNAITWNWGSLTTQTGLTLGGGSAQTSGSVLSLTGTTFAASSGLTGQVQNIDFTNAPTNTIGTEKAIGLNIAPTFGTSTGGGTHETYGLLVNSMGVSGTKAGTNNSYGIRIGNQGFSNGSTSYGLYVDSQSNSTNNYAARLDGKVAIGGGGDPLADLDITVASTGATLRLSPQSVNDDYTFSANGNGLVISNVTDSTTILNEDQAGHIGIGALASSSYKLQVSGTTNITSGLTAATFNGLTITNNGTNTLSIAAGKTLTASNTLTFTGTDSSSVNFGTGGTVCYAGTCAANAVRLDQVAAANTNSTIANGSNAIAWNWGSLTTQTGMTFGGGSAMTTGSVLGIGTATYVHTTSETGSLVNLTIADNSTNTSGAAITNALNINSTLNTSGAGTKTVNGINIAAPTLTACATAGCVWNGLQVSTAASGTAGSIFQTGISITPGGTISSGNFMAGLNINSATSGGFAAKWAINVGNNWDGILTMGSPVSPTILINGSGVLQSPALSGTYSNALTLSNTSNALAGTLTLQGGTASSPKLNFSGDTSTGLYSPTSGVVAVTGIGSEIIRFNTGGTVGINSTSTTGLLTGTGVANIAITGTVAVSSGSAAVVGTGTSFTTDLNVGDAIKIAGTIFTVATITDNTHLTLNTAAGSTLSGLTATKDPNLLVLNNAAGTNALTIDKSANLTSNGSITGNGVTSANGGMYINNTNTGGIQYCMYSTDNSNAAGGGRFVLSNSSVGCGTGASSALLTVTSAGSLGLLGTRSPSATLDIGSSNTIAGAGLTDCRGGGDRLIYNSTSKQFGCDTNMVKKIMSANQVRGTNSFSTVTDLTFSVAANETWIYRAVVAVASPSGTGNKWQVTGPSSPTSCVYDVSNVDDGNSIANGTCGNGGTGGLATTGNTDYTEITGSITNGSNAGSINIQFAQSTTGLGNSTLYANASYLVAYRVNGADLAEIYNTKDNSIAAGDVVSVDGSLTAGVKKSLGKYDSTVLGVVSTSPGQILGSQTDAIGRPVLLGLSGRVPTKVSTENGPIQAGDYITASSVPGVGMKATQPGQTIGKALESYSGEGVGKISVFLNLSYYQPLNTNQNISSQAQYFKQSYAKEQLPAGTVISLSGGKATKSLRGTTALGVAIAGQNTVNANGDHLVGVGLSGQLPVIVSNEQGDIKVDDQLGTQSLYQGVAAKSNKDDSAVLGQALTDAPTSNCQSVTSIEDISWPATPDATCYTLPGNIQISQILALIRPTTLGLSNTDPSLTEANRQVLQAFSMQNNVLTSNVSMNIIGNLSVSGGLTIGGPAEFKGPAIFRAVADFFDTVIFHKPVQFADHVQFNPDTAGVVKLAAGQTQASVTFAQPYAATPVINMTRTLADFTDELYQQLHQTTECAALDKNSCQQQWEKQQLAIAVNPVITSKSATGFTISLSQPASDDIYFSWSALATATPTPTP